MTQEEIFDYLARHGGVIAVRQHPRWVGALQWLARTGRLVRLYPGILCRPDDARDRAVRLAGAVLWHPDGVLMGAAAAAVSYLPQTRVDEIVMSTRRKRRSPRGIRLVRWEVPDELVMEREGVRFTAPALTALELSVRDNGHAIDEALRQGLATLNQLWKALSLSRYRLGNPRRRELLLESHDEPWSQAEREAHKVLRRGGLSGWLSNLAVNLSGTRALLDIAFDEWKVVLEVDGFEFHAFGISVESRRQFEKDRWKGTELVAAGWALLRVTWLQLTERPDWVLRMLRKTLAARGWTPRLTG